jgi:hypothetical protein
MSRDLLSSMFLSLIALATPGCGSPADEPNTIEHPAAVPDGQTMPEPLASEVDAEVSGDTGSTNWCPSEIDLPKCKDGYDTCAVRCCNNCLFKAPKECGECGDWSWRMCANNGTRRKVAWEPGSHHDARCP